MELAGEYPSLDLRLIISWAGSVLPAPTVFHPQTDRHISLIQHSENEPSLQPPDRGFILPSVPKNTCRDGSEQPPQPSLAMQPAPPSYVVLNIATPRQVKLRRFTD
jgi:hypothetical protein